MASIIPSVSYVLQISEHKIATVQNRAVGKVPPFKSALRSPREVREWTPSISIFRAPVEPARYVTQLDPVSFSSFAALLFTSESGLRLPMHHPLVALRLLLFLLHPQQPHRHPLLRLILSLLIPPPFPLRLLPRLALPLHLQVVRRNTSQSTAQFLTDRSCKWQEDAHAHSRVLCTEAAEGTDGNAGASFADTLLRPDFLHSRQLLALICRNRTSYLRSPLTASSLLQLLRSLSLSVNGTQRMQSRCNTRNSFFRC
jgi:hypothetical protein